MNEVNRVTMPNVLLRMGALLGLLGVLWVVVSALPAQALDEGARFPEIGLVDLAGKTVDRASLAGKVVVVDFWATWCTPCKQELPALEKLYRKYRDKGLVVVAVSVDKEPDNVRKLATELKLSFPVVHDIKHEVAGRFDPPRMPSSYVIDSKGIVRHVHAGFRAGDEAELEKELKALLAAAAAK